MFGKYWGRKKHKLLPEIRDFTDPQNHIRYEPNVNKLTYAQWFYMHPSAYKLIYYGGFAINIVMFGFLSFYGFYRGIEVIGIIGLIITIISLIGLVKRIKEYSKIKNLTFYDLYMREYNGSN